MKNIFTIFFSICCLSLLAQTHQNINKPSGTVSNPITEIDSIRFNGTNQMVVVTTSGNESHALTDITNVTFSNGANFTPCSGDITSVTDADGNEYPVVQIGNQCWTKENLKTTKFADGSVIPNVTSYDAWNNLSSPAWCNYENSASNDISYGKLYNWFTAADPRNVCPTGWHVPTDAEWTVLTDYLGGGIVAGGKMKSTTGWNAPNTGATNESGFSGLPGGYLDGYDGYHFGFVGDFGSWWSSTESSTATAWARNLYYSNGLALRSNLIKQDGLSVRCLRD
jgi:uncharacterized protein (TIGR02145 family)